MRRTRRRLLAGTLLLALRPAPAWPWGCTGHQTIALIAAQHLSPAGRARVDAILDGAKLAPTLRRLCPAPALGRLADLSTWADDVRGERPETGPWHYVDIPRGAPETSFATLCEPPRGCIVSALEAELRALRSTSTPAPRRAEALLFVVHLIADLHQPLHCITNGDRGGNCVPVESFGRRPRPRVDARHPARDEDYDPNLHAVWDGDLVERRRGDASVESYARRLDQRFADQARSWQTGDVPAWARETHRMADAVAYGRLPRPIPVEPAEDVRHCSERNHVARRMLALDERVDARYEAAAGPALDEQLARAGIRLAKLLDALP
jgi:hypothetical protein